MGASASRPDRKRDEREELLAPEPLSPRSVNRYETALHTDISTVTLSPAASTPSLDPRQFSVLILMSDTGGGHRASAQALDAAFDTLHPTSAVTIVDFWTDIAGFPFNNFPSQYAYLAKHPFLWKCVYLWAAFPPTRWLTETAFSVFCHSRVRSYFRLHDPDLIISVHPLVNTLSLSVLAYMKDLYGRPTPPFCTVVTDLGGAHPTWFDHRADLVYVPSDPLQQKAIDAGVRNDRIRLLGLPIRPAFWEETRSRAVLRTELGMAQHIPTVLLVGGGDGIGGLEAIADAIAVKISEEVGAAGGQLVVVCGKNRSLLRRMQARSWPIPVILKGFVNNMSEWMSACDILCSKAGPGTIAEAWTRGMPIILTGFLPGQEEGNVKLVTDSGSGEFHADPESIAKCASRWVSDPELRGAIAARAKSLGRPQSCINIVSDIWELGQERLYERDAYNRRMLLAPSTHMPNGYIAMGRFYIGSAFRSVQRMLGYSPYELERPRE